MPYRGTNGFSWQTAATGAHRGGAVAAIVLLAVGWSTGFFSGRMSAWLFPVIETNTAALSSMTKQPAAPRVAGATAASPAPQQPAPTTAASPPERPSPAPAQEPAKAPPNAQPASQQASETRTSEVPDNGAVLVNPEWDRVSSDNVARELQRARVVTPREPHRDADQREFLADRDASPQTERGRAFNELAVAKCQRQYSSFRPSDGTYQPYGSRSREVCPYLYQTYGRLDDRR